MRPAEYVTLGEITVSAYEALGGYLHDEYRALLRDVADRARSAVVLVAAEGDNVLGGVTYVPRHGPYAEFESDDEAGMRMLAVAPEEQNQGAGSALTVACMDRARADGKARLVLHTTPWMTKAHRIYARLGFRRAPERDAHPMPELHLMAYVCDLT